MKAISGKDLVRILEAHGWRLRRVHGSHHILTKDGSRVRLSVPVHGSESLKKGLLRHLVRQAGLDPEEDL